MSCLADHGDRQSRPFTDGPGVGGLEQAHLLVPAYQGCVETDRQRAQPACADRSRNRSGPASSVSMAPAASSAPGADEDLARFGGLGKHHRPGSHVTGEPERPRTSHQGLARRQAEVVDQVGAIMAGHVGRLRGERVPRFQAGPHCAQGIVLVHGGAPNTPIRRSLSLIASFPRTVRVPPSGPTPRCSCTTSSASGSSAISEPDAISDPRKERSRVCVSTKPQRWSTRGKEQDHGAGSRLRAHAARQRFETEFLGRVRRKPR